MPAKHILNHLKETFCCRCNKSRESVSEEVCVEHNMAIDNLSIEEKDTLKNVLRRKIGKRKKLLTVGVIGDMSVGKTTVISRFIGGKHSQNNNHKQESEFRKDIRYKDGKAELLIKDFSKQIKSPSYLPAANGYIVCYSVTSKDSFDRAHALLDFIRLRYACFDYPVILMGTKSDLDHRREVATKEGRSLAMSYECPFYETSSENSSSVVTNAFLELIDVIDTYTISCRHRDKPVRNKHCTGLLFRLRMKSYGL